MAKEATRVRRREREKISSGVAHVNSTFNNTMIASHGRTGQRDCLVLRWCAGLQGFAFKSTPFAAQMAAEDCAKKAQEHGMRSLEVEVCGPGSGRKSALRALQAAGFAVTSIRDGNADPAQWLQPPAQASPRLIFCDRIWPHELIFSSSAVSTPQCHDWMVVKARIGKN